MQKESYKNPAIWSQFLRCAARVRIVEHYDREILSTEALLIRTLFVFNQDTTFLPSLRRLTWILKDTTCSILPFICSSSLDTMRLTYYGGNTSVMSSEIASLTTDISPHVRTLSVHGSQAVHVLFILAMVSHMKELESLSIAADWLDASSSPVFVGSLATFPSLRRLNIIIRDGAFHNVISLPALSRLQCRGFPGDLLSFLKALDAPHMRDVEFSFEDGALSECARCVQKVSTKFPSIHSLGVTAWIKHPELIFRFITYEMSLPDILKSCPLSVLQTLEKLTIHMAADCRLSSFSGEDFNTLIKILPNLRHLTLSLPPRMLLPVSVLQAAALTCHFLAFFKIEGIRMDPSAWALIPLAPQGGNHPLRELHMMGLPLFDVEPASIAAYLDAIFPNLREMQGEQASEVMEHLRSLQRSRLR